MKIENTETGNGGKCITAINKSYLGYAPKNNNVSKLTQYLMSKNALSAAKNAVGKQTTQLLSNKIMQNKRF